MKHAIECLILASGIAALYSAGTADAQENLFELSSTTFQDGQMMPKKVGNSQANNPDNPNCLGENISPQLSWTNPPAGTKSFAFLMIDPEGRGGGGVVHWVAYGIPLTVTGFAEGEVSKESPNMSAARAGQALATSPARACRLSRRRGTTRSYWSRPISSQMRCRPA